MGARWECCYYSHSAKQKSVLGVGFPASSRPPLSPLTAGLGASMGFNTSTAELAWRIQAGDGLPHLPTLRASWFTKLSVPGVLGSLIREVVIDTLATKR